MKRLSLITVLVALVASLSAVVLAQDASDKQAVEAGRESLNGRVDFPWYDTKTDGIKRVDVAPPRDLKNRGSKWEARSRKKRQASSWQMPDWLWVMLEVLGWTALVIALVAVGYFLMRAFLAAEATGAAGSVSVEELLGAGHADRVESLPFQLKRPQADLLAEARKHYEAGNYAEAIIYLYSYELVELDKHQFIRLAKGKTNRQYLREVRRQRSLFDSLQATMLAFEDVFFGNHPLDRQRFESCWGQLDFFRQTLEQVAIGAST